MTQFHLDSAEVAALIDLVADAAEAVRDVATSADIGMRLKGRIDPVTEADERSEAILFQGLRQIVPEDSIVAEEGHRNDGTTGRIWYVDPLDGTVNFSHRHPPYAVTIGCVDEEGPLFGIVHDIASNQVYVARRGQGAYCGDQRLAVTSCESLESAMLTTGFPYWIRERPDIENNLTAFSIMVKAARAIRREGSAAIDMVNVARGTMDGYWETGLKPWDIAAGMVIVSEAGGMTTGLDGEPLRDLYAPLVCSNGNIHAEMLRVLEGNLMDYRSADVADSVG